MNDHRIAVVGIACRYPDADSTEQLWENVLAGRRAFRRLPDERMNLDDYYSADPAAPDRFYTRKAAVLEGFEFDRVGYRVAGSTFRSTDMTHWLALDTAARALRDAGFPDGEGLPRQATGVVIGNTLTGEFSRANLMRLRWPYVRRTVAGALREQGWDDAALVSFLDGLETRYKSPFPPIDEDTLAGGLANTIAGRICNFFDLHGGGYTVDGACSSSLLSAATAANALSTGQLDVAIVGGVDLSIDPFEVVGFAKTSALASDEMRVYDSASNGFWPGEGCGMLVLMRDEDAIARGLRRYAVLGGWGYSSDGRGGMTRPETAGHRLALSRAYESAGYGIETVGYFEGHGTGTAVGDSTELQTFIEARRAADPEAPTAAISTVKGNIGHTKAAAGVAGLIKAILAVHNEVIPPATGHHNPHPILTEGRPALRVPLEPEPWPAGHPIRAGVSSMGFGGINAHIVVEHADRAANAGLGSKVDALSRSRQDVELLLVDGENFAALRGRIGQLADLCGSLSFAELGDLAATLNDQLEDRPLRAAIVAGDPEEAAQRCNMLLSMLDNGARSVVDIPHGVFLGTSTRAPRVGFLFPGQGAGRRGDGGAMRRRFANVDALYRTLPTQADADLIATQNAQPRIVTSSIAGLRVLDQLGIEAVCAAGHSLGELTALHWAGATDEAGLLSAATARGRIMAQASDGNGTMASIMAAPEAVTPLLTEEPVVIAGYNSPQQTVVSGPADAVKRVCARAADHGMLANGIPVSHAFHSEAVAPAATAFHDYLRGERFEPLTRTMVSTVTGRVLARDTDTADLLTRQVLEPVRFSEAVQTMADEVDLFIEVGPGRILTNLAGDIAPGVPAVALDTDSMSLSGLLDAIALAYALGAPVRHGELFENRFTREFALDKQLRFLASPCESAPVQDLPVIAMPDSIPAPLVLEATSEIDDDVDTLDLLRQLAADRAELPIDAVSAHSNPIDELHLSSITVGQIVTQAARKLGRAVPLATSAFATSTLTMLAGMLDNLDETSHVGADQSPAEIVGAGPWVRAFSVELVPTEPPPAAARQTNGDWELFAPEGHPISNALRAALRRAGLGGGVLLCLPHDCNESHAALMLDAARAAIGPNAPGRFVVVGDRRGAAGLAKTLHLEAPAVATTLVTLPLAGQMPADQVAQIALRVVADVVATAGFAEIVYDGLGTRYVPQLRPLPVRRTTGDTPALGSEDVLLVTGGGKGITAECALDMARTSGASIALLGRSKPASDQELASNLARMTAAGVSYRYVSADITSTAEVTAAIEEVQRTFGPVTAILHGAGRNVPQALGNLDELSFQSTLATKVTGLETVLAATDPAKLRLLVTFGSIIGRAGLRGEADYATANDWLTDLTYRIQDDFPNCRCLALEWSVWSGTGMGERLGVLESLMRDGIRPIPADEGVAMLRRLLDDPDAPTSVVVMGRAEGLPTITFEPRELPLLRFLDRQRVHYPGVELVVDADLSADDDPYLADHQLDGDLLFPAVFGMEAMAQAAKALTGRSSTPVLEDVEFLRPVVVPIAGTTTIRVAALVIDDGSVQAVVRCGETAYQADHFRATLRFDEPLPADSIRSEPTSAPQVPLSPPDELYGPVLFQGERFQRLLGYRELAAKGCVADLSNRMSKPWFGEFLPADLVLADPGTRDAAMHSIQCCVPDATLLPAATKRLYLADPARVRALDRVTLHAVERSRIDDTYIYDLDIRDSAGALVERWEGLRLQAVRKQDGSGPWTPTLLGPYLERRSEAVLPSALQVAVLPDTEDVADGLTGRRKRTARALSVALRREASPQYRPDGKPEVDGGIQVSAAHGSGLTFVVAAEQVVGCDVEAAATRSGTEWSDLLGVDGFALANLIARERGEGLSIAATRVWGAQECLRKIGHARAELVEVSDQRTDQWVMLRSGSSQIATFATAIRGLTEPAVFAMLTDSGRSRE